MGYIPAVSFSPSPSKDWHWLRLVPVLLVAMPLAARSQGIIYGQFPATSPVIFPEDANGTRILGEMGFPAQTYNFVVNGQTVCTFFSDGTGFLVQPSSLSAVIAVQPNLESGDQTTFPVPLASGQEIGSDAAGYSWLGNILGGDTLTAARDGGAG